MRDDEGIRAHESVARGAHSSALDEFHEINSSFLLQAELEDAYEKIHKFRRAPGLR